MSSLYFLVMLLLPHKFHASITELELNHETGKLEVVLRLFTDDLEAALSKRLGRKVVIDQEVDLSQEVLAYVKEVFEVRDLQGNPLPLAWVGLELQVKNTWIYVETLTPETLEGVTLSQHVFCELFRDQVNTVNLKDGEKHSTLVFKTGERAKPLIFSP